MDESGDKGGHYTSPNLQIRWLGNLSFGYNVSDITFHS